MGLDSVDLVVTVENLFGIRIPDIECEQINTVQDFADSVYKRISINPTKKCLTQIIFYRFRKAFQKLNLLSNVIEPETRITELFPQTDLKTNWNRLETELELKLPELVDLDFNRNLDTHVKFLGFRTFKRSQPVTKGTIRQLIDWTISLNFDKTINLEKITSKYEVERIISGLINNQIGIPINEIELRHSIANDLGVD